MARDSFRVAALQPFEPRNADDNAQMQDSAWSLAEDAAAQGGAVVVFPEFFNVMGIPADRAHRFIEDCRPQLDQAKAYCRRHGAWLLLPLVEQRQGKRFNTAHLVNPDGEIAHTYDKTHLTIGEKRDYDLTPGERICAVDTDLCRIGVMICYDVYFPEVVRILALDRSQLILFPSLQRSDTEEGTMLLNRVRAMDSTSYLVRSSFGQKVGHVYKPGMMYGGSCVVGPDGSILATAGRFEGTATAQIDPHTPWQRQRCGGMGPQPVRQFLDEDRRPELYGAVSGEKQRPG